MFDDNGNIFIANFFQKFEDIFAQKISKFMKKNHLQRHSKDLLSIKNYTCICFFCTSLKDYRRLLKYDEYFFVAVGHCLYNCVLEHFIDVFLISLKRLFL